MRKRVVTLLAIAVVCIAAFALVLHVVDRGFVSYRARYPMLREGHRRFYLLQGDVLVPEATLRNLYRRERLAAIAEKIGFVYTITLRDGMAPTPEDTTWKAMPITYTISGDGLSATQFACVKARLAEATHDWESICNVHFTYMAHAAGEVGFHVKAARGPNDDFVATAFIGPNADDRTLRVFPTFFETDYCQRGVFRHELGHVLGFIHEHNDLQSPSACTKDDPLPAAHLLTAYDRRSVMHYFCGPRGGTRVLGFSDCDQRGAQRKYPFGATPGTGLVVCENTITPSPAPEEPLPPECAPCGR